MRGCMLHLGSLSLVCGGEIIYYVLFFPHGTEKSYTLVGLSTTVGPNSRIRNTITPELVADTIYACQDKRDDVQAGVKSTALLFGAHVKKILAVFAASLVACLAVAGLLNGQGIPYFMLTVGGAAAHIMMQLRNLDVDDPNSCLHVVRLSAPASRNYINFGIVRV